MNDTTPTSHISITTGTIARFFLIAVLFVSLYYLFDVILVILASVVIASSIEPVVRRFENIGVNRIVAVIIIGAVLALVLTVVLIFFLPQVLNETVEFLGNLPEAISLQQLWSPVGDIGTDSSLGSRIISVEDLIGGLQSIVIGTGSDVFKTISVVSGGVLSFILIIVLAFYLAAKKDGVADFLRMITPVKHHDYIVYLWKRSQRKIGFWLQGQVILAVIVGFLVYVGLMVTGVPHALILALLAGVLEIIPIFGPIFAAIPAVLVAFGAGGWGFGVLIIGIYLVIQQLENHILYPLVVRKVVGMSPVVVIIALIIGGKLAGILGAVVAVPLAAAFMEYLNDVEKSRKAEVEVKGAKS